MTMKNISEGKEELYEKELDHPLSRGVPPL